MATINQENPYSLSSWNYGSYSCSNPCYIQQAKNINRPKGSATIPHNQYNKYGKRQLREEERIVTNEYMQNINHMKRMEQNARKGIFRTKSAKGMRTTGGKNESVSQKNNTSMNNDNQGTNGDLPQYNNTKSDTNNYRFRLTYDEWLAVKKKQLMIFNQIKKIKEEEDIKMEMMNKKVDKKYQQIKDQKYKEW